MTTTPRRMIPLQVMNVDSARFDCTFGRGCEGICCRNGRPPVWPEEAKRIEAVLPRVLPLLRPAAAELLKHESPWSRRRKAGQPMLRVQGGWCVFFNAGCVLHKLGADEGDAFRYKPGICAVFPLAKNDHGQWYVRQHGVEGEIWDLFCLDPKASDVPAAQSLKAEIAHLPVWDAEPP